MKSRRKNMGKLEATLGYLNSRYSQKKREERKNVYGLERNHIPNN